MMTHRHPLIHGVVLILILAFGGLAWGHQVQGRISPEILDIRDVLEAIGEGRYGEAFRRVEGIDILSHGARLDRTYGTRSNRLLSGSLVKKDPEGLKRGLHLLGFLLMREQFDALEVFSEKGGVETETARDLYWSSRNIYSTLFESVVRSGNVVEGKSLDRLLDRMLYAVQDGEWEGFGKLREELIERLARLLNLSMPNRPVDSGTSAPP